MSSRQLAVLGAIAVALSAAPLRAQTDEFKVGVIIAERLVRESPEYKQAEETFRLKMETQTSQLEARREELRAVQERVITEGTTLDANVRADLIQSGERMQTEIDRMTQDIQAEMRALQQELLAPVYERVDNAVLAYIEDSNLDLVLDGSNPMLGLLFVDKATDITDAVLARMGTASSEAGDATDRPQN